MLRYPRKHTHTFMSDLLHFAYASFFIFMIELQSWHNLRSYFIEDRDFDTMTLMRDRIINLIIVYNLIRELASIYFLCQRQSNPHRGHYILYELFTKWIKSTKNYIKKILFV